jgi:hypothetical protein
MHRYGPQVATPVRGGPAGRAGRCPRSGRPPTFTAWLDQAELYFSAVQRKALTPNDFTSLDQIRERLAAFEIRYNAIARPVHLDVHPHRPQRPATPHRRP